MGEKRAAHARREESDEGERAELPSARGVGVRASERRVMREERRKGEEDRGVEVRNEERKEGQRREESGARERGEIER